MILKIQTKEISDFKAGENMSLNSVPAGERLHIGFFGVRNVGKSSIVNAIANQEISLVSDVKGTTTDPIKKSMELSASGPVVLIDTPGFDDEGKLGEMRVKKTREILSKIDFAVLVADASTGLTDADRDFISLFKVDNIPYITVYNKADTLKNLTVNKADEIAVSAKEGYGINELKDKISAYLSAFKKEKPILDDIITAGDTVVLVTPVDESAPKGRLILPQQITLRNILDNNCSAVVCKELPAA